MGPAGWWGVSCTPGITGTASLPQTVPQASSHWQMWPVACGFISPSQSDRLTYLAQQLLDQSVLVLLQVKIRSEIQVNGGSCSQKTDIKLSPCVGREQPQQHSSD